MAVLTKEQTLNQALLDYRASLPKPDNDVIVDDKTKTDWGSINNIFISGTTITPVLCKDGTTQIQKSSPTGKYADACINNGGRAENKPVVVNTEVYAKQNLSSEEKFYESLGIKSRGGYSPTVKAKGRFYLAVVLVAGYFAYKKFKK
jgi:hypothetical protein